MAAERRIRPSQIVLIVLVVLIIIFVVQNRDVATLRFLGWSIEASLAIHLTVTFAIGLVVGLLAPLGWRKGRGGRTVAVKTRTDPSPKE